MRNYIVLVLVLVAIVLLGEFVMQFSDWNKEQACASAGRRNCSSGTSLSLFSR